MSDGSHDRERAALFDEYRRTGDRDVRNRLIELNFRLAETIANRYTGRGERHDDLAQVAMVGLLKAVERFEPERGLAFSSFATPTIEGELKRHFRDQRWAVRVPRHLQELSLEINHSVAALSQRSGRSPTVAEIAADTGHREELVLEALEAGRASLAVSLDSGPPAADDEASAPVDRLGAQDPGLEGAERRLIVAGLLKSLPQREQAIVALRFYDGLTQSQIAEQFGISQMQVSRLLARSLERLRIVAGE
jgi:RNA polymerase sigma-B factor